MNPNVSVPSYWTLNWPRQVGFNTKISTKATTKELLQSKAKLDDLVKDVVRGRVSVYEESVGGRRVSDK